MTVSHTVGSILVIPKISSSVSTLISSGRVISTRVAFVMSQRRSWKLGGILPECSPSLFHRQPLLVAPRTLDRARVTRHPGLLTSTNVSPSVPWNVTCCLFIATLSLFGISGIWSDRDRVARGGKKLTTAANFPLTSLWLSVIAIKQSTWLWRGLYA